MNSVAEDSSPPGIGAWLATCVFVATAAVIAAAVGTARVHPLLQSDAGAYLTIGSLLLRGYRLYDEVFEAKDPAFLYMNALGQWLFGVRGPAIGEVAVLSIAGVAGASYLRARGIGRAISLIVAALVVLALTPDSGAYAFAPALSHTWGMSAAFIGIVCALRRWWGAAGALVVLAALLEFRNAPIALAVGAALVVVSTDPRRSGRRYLIGLGSAAAGAALFLGIREELSQYLHLFEFNFEHLQIGLRALDRGNRRGLIAETADGMVEVARTAPLLVAVTTLVLVTSLAVLIYMTIRRSRDDEPRSPFARFTTTVQGESLEAILAALVASILTLPAVGATFLWVHHLQPLGLVCALALIAGVDFLGRRGMRRGARAVVLVILVPALLLVGLSRSTVSVDLDLWREALTSPPADALNRAASGRRSVEYAMAGDLFHELGHAAFTDEQLHFSCDLVYQHPWDRERFDDYVDCLQRTPDLVLYTSYDEGLRRTFPRYETLRLRVERVLAGCFERVPSRAEPTYKVFERRRACVEDADVSEP